MLPTLLRPAASRNSVLTRTHWRLPWVGARADGSKVPGLCVRCPRHRMKFGGGLWFSLEDGRSFVRGQTAHWDPMLQTSVHLTEVRRPPPPAPTARRHSVRPRRRAPRAGTGRRGVGQRAPGAGLGRQAVEAPRPSDEGRAERRGRARVPLLRGRARRRLRAVADRRARGGPPSFFLHLFVLSVSSGQDYWPGPFQRARAPARAAPAP